MTRPVIAVDLGDTTVTAAVDPGADDPDGPPALDPVDLAPDLAAVFAPTDGAALVTGEQARRLAAADPSRYEPTPRRRADDGELLLGTRLVGVAEAWGAVVSDAVARAGSLLRGGRPRGLVLTHPPGWDAGRVELLRRAGSGLADELVLLTEPVAAASYAAWMRPQREAAAPPVAVLDVGAGAATASVVVAARGEVLAHRTDRRFGGADADEVLLAHLLADASIRGRGGDRVREVAAGTTLGDRRHRQVLLDDVRAARERLSDTEQAEIPLPGGGTPAWLARSEAEEVLARAWRGVVGLLADVVAEAGTTTDRLDAVWLTGGAARTPQLAALVHRELGVPATVAPDPGAVVARGALVAAREIARRRAAPAAVPASSPTSPPAATPPSGPPGATLFVAPPGGGPPAGPAPTVPGPSPARADPSAGGFDPSAGGFDPAAPFGPDDPLGWYPMGWDTDDHGVPGPVPDGLPDARTDTDPDVDPGADAPTVPIPLGPGPDGFGRAAWRRPLPGSRRRRRVALAALVAAAAVVVGATALVLGQEGEPGGGTMITAYSHRVLVPAGWVREGGDDTARRTVLRPVDAPRGADLIAIQDNPAETDPARVRTQMRAQYDAARSAGSPVSDLQPDATVAGRDVVRYRQDAAPGVRVDWIIVLTPGSQVSVGCRYAGDSGTGDADRVRAACDQVVAGVGPLGS